MDKQTTPKFKPANFSPMEREAIKLLISERMAGDAHEFYRNACGLPDDQAQKLAEALEKAVTKL